MPITRKVYRPRKPDAAHSQSQVKAAPPRVAGAKPEEKRATIPRKTPRGRDTQNPTGGERPGMVNVSVEAPLAPPLAERQRQMRAGQIDAKVRASDYRPWRLEEIWTMCSTLQQHVPFDLVEVIAGYVGYRASWESSFEQPLVCMKAEPPPSSASCTTIAPPCTCASLDTFYDNGHRDGRGCHLAPCLLEDAKVDRDAADLKGEKPFKAPVWGPNDGLLRPPERLVETPETGRDLAAFEAKLDDWDRMRVTTLRLRAARRDQELARVEEGLVGHSTRDAIVGLMHETHVQDVKANFQERLMQQVPERAQWRVGPRFRTALFVLAMAIMSYIGLAVFLGYALLDAVTYGGVSAWLWAIPVGVVLYLVFRFGRLMARASFEEIEFPHRGFDVAEFRELCAGMEVNVDLAAHLAIKAAGLERNDALLRSLTQAAEAWITDYAEYKLMSGPEHLHMVVSAVSLVMEHPLLEDCIFRGLSNPRAVRKAWELHAWRKAGVLPGWLSWVLGLTLPTRA